MSSTRQKIRVDIPNYISNVFLFSSLNKNELDQLASDSTIFRVNRGTQLFSQGDEANSLYVIVYGKLSIYRVSYMGEQQVIHIHQDGDIVAEAAIFDQIKYPASCMAVKDSLVVKISEKSLTELIMNNPKMALKMMASYSKRLREFVTTVEYLSLDDVKMRILKYLQRHVKFDEELPTVRLGITKKELAGILSTAPETISRNLRKLKEEGLISEKSGVIRILDKPRFDSILEI